MPVQTAAEKALAEKKNYLREYLENPTVREQLARAMPRNLDPDRMLRQVFSLVQRTPKLLDCTRHSIGMGMMTAAELGLELTALGHAWLIPRKLKGTMTAVFQIGYKGLVALAMRAPTLRSIEVGVVHAADDFDYQMGTSSYLKHRAGKDPRGETTHYYAISKYVNGGHDFEVWTVEKAREHKQRYASNSGPDSPWNTAFDAMALKSVVSALCRRQSLCPEAQAAATTEHYEEVGVLAEVPQAGGKTALLLGKLDDEDAAPAEPAAEVTT